MIDDRSPVPPERLEQAAGMLRPLERQVLFLSATEGLRNHEVAARLGITAEAAEGLLAAALRKLDRAFDRKERPWWRLW